MYKIFLPKIVIYTSAFLLLVSCYLFLVTKSYAQCTSSNLNQGLISALSISGGAIGNIDQTCVVDPQAAYRDFKVPSYSDLENKFYTTSTSLAKKTDQRPNGIQNFSGDGIYLQTDTFNVSAVNGSGVQIIFVRGNLYITSNINYADTDPTSGLVFIVQGDIYIDSNITKVNAVLVSSGTICTAYITASGTCSNGSAFTPQLVINGSLISINKNDLPDDSSAILLTRNLTVNNQPAEVINKQAKYLYILKGGLLTEDLIITQEDANYTITQDPNNPTPPPPPTIIPSCAGSKNPLDIAANIVAVISSCVLFI